MFRYGGPIKEGIMTGMQDRPGYKKGSLIAGLISKIPGGQAADVANLGQLGAFRQGLTQSQLAADQQAAQTAAYEPFGRLSTYGTGLTGLAGGVAGQQFQQPAAPSPFSTALSTALGIGGLFGKFR